MRVVGIQRVETDASRVFIKQCPFRWKADPFFAEWMKTAIENGSGEGNEGQLLELLLQLVSLPAWRGIALALHGRGSVAAASS